MIFGLFARKKEAPRRAFTAPDGTVWGMEVRWPGASNAMVVFHHPDVSTSGLNRYAWWLSDGAQARDVTARMSAPDVLAALTDEQVRTLFRKSMPISSPVPRFEPA